MRLKGLKFVNNSGHPVRVMDVKFGVGVDKKTEFVFYQDARANWGGPNYLMRMKKPVFIKRYRKSLDDFKKSC